MDIYSLPKVICLFHILSPELSPPKQRNGQFYEILFYHIYEKLVCVGLYTVNFITLLSLYFGKTRC